MLLEYGAKNFFSFKEGFEISFCNSKSIATVMALKGANASGKTNAIKALSFLSWFAVSSFSKLQPNEKIPFSPFFHNKDEITELYARFLYEGIEYIYELELTKDQVVKEILYKKEKRLTKVLERSGDKLSYISKKMKDLKAIKINRNNASIISIANQYEIEAIEPFYRLFKNIFTNVGVYGKQPNEKIFTSYTEISKFYANNRDIFDFVVDFLKKADTGIDDIEIVEKEDPETGEKLFVPIFLFKIDGETRELSFYEQSNGVQSLYIQLGFYATVLKDGMVLALDEFDINLHPDLLPWIVNFFEDETFNKNHAQFIFTTHNNEIMDRLGKYRVVFVNKEENESYLYRLDEIPGDMLRNDRPITPVYQANKIGGRPRISNA